MTYGYGRDLTDEVLNTWVSPHTGHQFGLYGLLRTPVGTFYVSPIVADLEIVIPGLAAPLWEGGLEVRRGLTTRASGTGTTARRSRTPIASREPRPTRERRTPAPLRLGDSGFRRRPRARSGRHSSDRPVHIPLQALHPHPPVDTLAKTASPAARDSPSSRTAWTTARPESGHLTSSHVLHS